MLAIIDIEGEGGGESCHSRFWVLILIIIIITMLSLTMSSIIVTMLILQRPKLIFSFHIFASYRTIECSTLHFHHLHHAFADQVQDGTLWQLPPPMAAKLANLLQSPWVVRNTVRGFREVLQSPSWVDTIMLILITAFLQSKVAKYM